LLCRPRLRAAPEILRERLNRLSEGHPCDHRRIADRLKLHVPRVVPLGDGKSR
jgi:hypothetical protein